jgi:glycine/D-amino acid oxidase-like deaminating enzyme
LHVVTLCVVPVRATKRGQERTPLDGSHDVLICGASFAGLAVARELAESGADVLVVDRYEIGERQTSACGIPTLWMEALGLMDAERQRFDSLLMHTPHGDSRFPLPFTFSTFDYRELCELLWSQCGEARFETAKVDGRGRSANGDGAIAVETDRGTIRAPLVVDALGWRRVLASGDGYQPPDAPLSRGLEVHPDGAGEDLEVWIDRRYVPAGYGWSFPARDELRIGVGSFDPRFHVRETTELLADDLGSEKVRYQGNWIPHKLRALLRDRAGTGAARRGRRAPEPRGGGRQLCRVQRLARVEVPLDAARAEAGAEDPTAPARAAGEGDGGKALRRVVLRPLPANRAA